MGGPGDDTVYARAVTLNAGDSLTGVSGTDILAPVGSGNLLTASWMSLVSATAPPFREPSKKLLLKFQDRATRLGQWPYGIGAVKLALGFAIC